MTHATCFQLVSAICPGSLYRFLSPTVNMHPGVLNRSRANALRLTVRAFVFE